MTRDEKIVYVRNIVRDYGSFTPRNVRMNFLYRNMGGFRQMLEGFGSDNVEVVTYGNGGIRRREYISYNDLPDNIIDEIITLAQIWQAVQLGHGRWYRGAWQYGRWQDNVWHEGRWNDGTWHEGAHDGGFYDGMDGGHAEGHDGQGHGHDGQGHDGQGHDGRHPVQGFGHPVQGFGHPGQGGGHGQGEGGGQGHEPGQGHGVGHPGQGGGHGQGEGGGHGHDGHSEPKQEGDGHIET